jgi:glycosyltransferase involved in cell wall biosynthesis
MAVTLLVFTIDEIEGMRTVMPRVKPGWVDQILLVDGGSTDGTVEYAREQGYDIYVQKKKALRNAYIESLPLARGDTVIAFSPDGNSPPEAIPELIRKYREGYDVVVASRYLPPARSYDDDIVTAFGNRLFQLTINGLHRANVTDPMTIYRIFRKSLFYELELDKEEHYFPEKLLFTILGPEPLMSIRCAKSGKKVGEIPADEPKRIGGVRKLQIVRWGLGLMVQAWRELYYWKPAGRAAGGTEKG